MRVLFVGLANDIGIDRLPSAMGALGAECAVLCPPGFYCATSRFVQRWFALPSHRGLWLGIPFIRRRLEAASRAWRADLIVPLDNVAAQLLRIMAKGASVSATLKGLLLRSLGSPHGYSDACSRSGLMRLAADLGLNMPQFCVTNDASVMLKRAEAWGYPVVLKAENTCGGHGVTIASSPDELRAALAALRGGNLWRRLRGNARKKVWSLAGFRETAGAPPMLQAFARGVPAMRTVSAWRGHVLEGVSFVAEQTHPAPTGPSTMVRYIENAAMDDMVRRLVAAMGCSGFISCDFMFDEETGAAALIEMNPRPIGTTHLGRRFGHDPCASLLNCLDEGFAAPPPPCVAEADTVALFPKEIERDPGNLRRLQAAGVYHDVPHDEPGIVAAYLRRLNGIHPADVPGIMESVRPFGGEPFKPTPASQGLGGRMPLGDGPIEFDARAAFLGGSVGLPRSMPRADAPKPWRTG